MVERQKGLLEFLEQLRHEREELNLLIRGVEKRLGVVAESRANEPNGAATPRVTISLDSIPVGFFHNLGQAEAADKLLRLNPGHPLETSEIVEALRKSGMSLNPKNAMTVMYTALKRNPKFERVAGKAWGLAEWYPEKRKRKDSEAGDSEPEP